MPSLDGLVVTYRGSERGCLEEYEEQVCAAGAPIAPSGGVTGGASDRKDMGSCPCRKTVPVRVPG